MKRIIFISLIFCLTTLPVAAKTKIPNYLKSIVFMLSSKDENVLGVGFICEINGKKTVISRLKTFVYDFPPVIKTIDGEVLTFSKAKISEDKRNLIFFELSDETSSDLVKVIPFETDVTGNTDINGKIVLYGKKPKSKTIKYIKGKLIGVGMTDMEIHASGKYNYTGGPVISVDTGKCIACIVAGRSKDNKYLTATRFDNIKNFLEINPAWVKEDIVKIEQKKNILEKIQLVALKFSKLYDDLKSRVKQEYGTTNINSIKSRHKQTIQYIQAQIKQLEEPVNFNFPFYQNTFPTLIQEAKEILKEVTELKFKNIENEKEESREKSSKSGKLERPTL